MKKILIVLIILVSFTFMSCKDKDNNNKEVMYTVSFEGTTMASQKVKEGSTLSKPVDPQINDKIFAGWYSDASYTTIVVFPLTIKSDTKIYAKFYSLTDAFEQAREKTIGPNVLGYEYDYTLTATASYNNINFTGTTTGNTKYSTKGEFTYYDASTNTGLLFNDGSKYQIRKDNILQKITLNEKNEVTKYESEVVNNSYTYDTSSFAKALFEYSNEQLKSVEKQSNGEYKLNTSMSASKGIALVGNYLNHPIIENLIGTLPETSVNTNLFVTFSDGEIKTYRYIMDINVNNLTFNLEYKLTFKNVGLAQTLNPQQFAGLSISANDISSKESTINSILNGFMSKEHSSYDFEVTTGMDFGTSSLEINSTFKGSTMRKVEDDIVYFHNDISVDSDLKNPDLYEDAGIEDFHIKKTMLANKEVHLIEKKFFADKTYLQDSYDKSVDDYYLFRVFDKVDTINYIQTITTSNQTAYKIGVSNQDILDILLWLNQTLDLDPLKNSSQSVKVFGDLESNSIKIEEFEFTIIVKNNVLYSIEVSSRGMINTKYTNSKDFNLFKEGEFDFNLKIVVNDKGNDFEPFETVKDAK